MSPGRFFIMQCCISSNLHCCSSLYVVGPIILIARQHWALSSSHYVVGRWFFILHHWLASRGFFALCRRLSSRWFQVTSLHVSWVLSLNSPKIRRSRFHISHICTTNWCPLFFFLSLLLQGGHIFIAKGSVLPSSTRRKG